MSEWKELKIEDFCEVIGGGTPSTKEDSYYGGEISWITPRDLTNYKKRLISRGERNITELGLKNSSARILPKNSILLTSRAPIGYLAIAEKEVCTNQGFKSLIINPEKADYNFVYYIIKSNVERIKGLGTGTTFAEISGSVVKNLKFSLPDLPTQSAIAEILSSLDDKIELNNKINQELETLAQTLFKQWFIDFEFPNDNGEPYKSSGGEMVDSELGEIPKGWNVKTLKDEFVLNMGQSPKGDTYNTNGDGIVFFQGRSDFGFRFPSIRMYTNDPKKIAKKFETLISVRAPVGDINMVAEDCCIGRGLGSISHTLNLFSYTFHKILSLQDELKSYDNEGTVFGSINKETLGNIKNIIPPISICKLFDQLSNDNDSLIFSLTRESQELVKTRDTLLPKLISGELGINKNKN
ncbi:MAG: restriction endonuclease subunit S [Crocinitomicaceae bacterium]|nr:restriction endonuclease subunit S [Crocinitomicaceae bacterium]